MSAEGMSRTVLHTGLDQHIDKFLDEGVNELPKGSPETDYFILEAALQRGFEMIDDDGDVYVCSSRQVVELVKPYRDYAHKPIDMVLHCPACGLQHIDANEANNKTHSPGCDISCGMPAHGCSCGFDALWTNPPHRSHLCHGCGHIWRPADVPTNGVQAVKTKGKVDSEIDNTLAQRLKDGEAAIGIIEHQRMVAREQAR